MEEGFCLLFPGGFSSAPSELQLFPEDGKSGGVLLEIVRRGTLIIVIETRFPIRAPFDQEHPAASLTDAERVNFRRGIRCDFK